MEDLMPRKLLLLPAPRRLKAHPGKHPITDKRLILINSPDPQTLLFTATRVQSALRKNLGVLWEVVASPAVPQENIGLTLYLGDETISHDQGYTLDIAPEKIKLSANSEAGVFYGVSTLIQIINQHGPDSGALPCLTISDWPDYAIRGVMLDVSRDKVPTMETVFDLVDRLAGWKINQFQLYIEHTFAYHQHPEVWAKASPFTGQEIMELDAFCRERFIELVPNQNTFGHMQHWLEQERYAPLAETDHGWDAWGTHFDTPFSLNPTHPGSLKLVKSLLDEYLPYFSSNQINVGCDETLDVGQGKNEELVEKVGRGRLYLDFVKKIYQEVSARGKKMQFWGDIIIDHPDLISELPADVTALEWGYEASHPFDEHGALFAKAGLKYYVCPGTASWNSIAGRTDNALANLINAAENGLKHGAAGYLNTDWGDNGHWQTLPVSYLGFAMGAAYSWALKANRKLDVRRALSLHAFEDPTGSLGRVAYDMGNIYLSPGIVPPNSSWLFWILQWPLDEVRTVMNGLSVDMLDNIWKAIDSSVAPLKNAHSARSDSDLIHQEFRLAERMLRHAVMRARLAAGREDIKPAALYVDMKAIIDEYKSIWLERNRPGGMRDSISRLEKARSDYA
jgi:hexosaminidase